MRLPIRLLLYSGSLAIAAGGTAPDWSSPSALILGTLTACRSQPSRPAGWEVGYWYWRHSSPDAGPVASRWTPDVVYVQVGNMSRSGLDESQWPARLPPARSYIATWRSDEAGPPDGALAPALAAAFERLQAQAAHAGQRVVGLQLDVDCPTRLLPAYADFVRSLRPCMHGHGRVSVTALLDWFEKGTQVRDLLAGVDEYVPQFYDARARGPGAEISEPIDAPRWAPVFNGLGTPYRIGLSMFGRIQRVRFRANGIVVREPFRDVRLLELWAQGLRMVHSETNRSAEQVLRWDVPRAFPPALEPGDLVEAILPTRESVRSGNEAAHAFGGLCVGVVFFRWPVVDETLVMTPDEIADSLSGVVGSHGPPRLQVSDGSCVGLHCSDLTAHLDDRFSPRPLELEVVASSDVEYLVPAHSAVTIRQTGFRKLVVGIPAFVGEREVRLGRAFSRLPSHYEVVGGRP